MNNNEHLQRLYHQFEREHDGLPAIPRDVVEWALHKGLLVEPKVDPVALLARDLSRALREEYRTDVHVSDLVMRAAELIAVIVKEQVREETSRLRAQLNAAQDERGEARRDYDELREQTRTLRGNALLAASIVRNHEEWRAERDAARAELAGVAAQRDAQLSRSVELAARVTELEARLNAQFRTVVAAGAIEAGSLVKAAPVEVDGFRVGDLVRFNGDVLPLLKVFFDETVGHSFGTVECDSPYRRKSCSQLHHMVRKPVGVGDTVRIVEGGHAGCIGRVDGIVCGEARVVTDPNASVGEALWVMLPRLVAVAP